MPNKSLKKLVLSPLVYSLLSSDQEAVASAKTLKEAANGLGIYMGTAMTIQGWEDSQYTETIIQEFDLITAENSCKMSTIVDTLDDIGTWLDFKFYWNSLFLQNIFYDNLYYHYGDCSRLFQFAKSFNLHFRGHATIWGNVGSTHYTPQFIQDETDPAKIEAFMKNYIHATVG